MLGNCERCGALIYVNAGRQNNTLCPDCRKKAQAEKERDSQKYQWTVHCKQSQAMLESDVALANRLGLSYGELIAAIHDGRIKRSGGLNEHE